jgi:hypothetical protein
MVLVRLTVLKLSSLQKSYRLFEIVVCVIFIVQNKREVDLKPF